MRRLLVGVGAGVCFAAAALILLLVGLPDRAVYSGTLTADGVRVAPEIGALAPPFQAQTLNGEFELAARRGTPVVVNFWATWCVPCAVEMPELQTIHEEGAAYIVGVNLAEPRGAVSAWADAYGITFDLAFDPSGEIASLYALRGQPSTYIIAPDGIIQHIYFGATNAASLRDSLRPFNRSS